MDGTEGGRKVVGVVKVVFTVPGIADESAGPSYTVPSLCKAVQDAGAEVSMSVIAKSEKRQYPYPVKTHQVDYFPADRVYLYSREFARSLAQDAKEVDVIHVNGIWMHVVVAAANAIRKTLCKIVYCPRGGLSKTALSRGRMLKWLFWHFLGQKRLMRATAMFHAASMKEHDEIRALGFKQPIAVIPNGIDVPKVQHKPFAMTNRKIAFFGRIHPTKAADHLVEAWGRVAADFPEWSLEIAGPDCGAVPQLKAMIDGKKIPRVSLLGELKGKAKYEFLAQADLYVLPSLTENFGITIAEALVCGTPCIASKGCPWEGLEGPSSPNGYAAAPGRAGWWIDIGPDALEKQLRESLKVEPEVLEEMGRRGKAWMERDYVWAGIGKKMLAAYEWLVNGGERPEWVLV